MRVFTSFLTLLISVTFAASHGGLSSPINECPPGNHGPLITYQHETDCDKFYACVDGEKECRDCPAGLHYDPKQGSCDWPDIANCQLTSPKPTTTEKITTAKPTTQRPPHIPTQPPSHIPTQPPSHIPTQPPSHIPTQPPSHIPTKPPTAAPTTTKRPPHIPTQPPSHIPTTTKAPSHIPTQPPTLAPTTTKRPSHIPTQPPSHIPTQPPSHIPTTTKQPSHIPTQPPTSAPTTTKRPSHIPTQPPSHIPTTTKRPSHIPTQPPSHIPTTTKQPSHIPTQPPSHIPTTTKRPSHIPTQPPSHIPTQPPTPGHLPPSSSKPSTSTPPQLPTECPPIGEEEGPVIHLPHETNCSLFYKCDHGEKVCFECPAGLQFNAILQVCDWPWNCNCEDKKSNGLLQRAILFDNVDHKPPTTPSTTIQTTTDPSNNPNTCIGSCPIIDPIEFTIQLPNIRCDKFCKCSNGCAIVQSCPPGLHYCTETNVCTWPNQAKCTGIGRINEVPMKSPENPEVVKDAPPAVFRRIFNFF